MGRTTLATVSAKILTEYVYECMHVKYVMAHGTLFSVGVCVHQISSVQILLIKSTIEKETPDCWIKFSQYFPNKTFSTLMSFFFLQCLQFQSNARLRQLKLCADGPDGRKCLKSAVVVCTSKTNQLKIKNISNMTKFSGVERSPHCVQTDPSAATNALVYRT